MSHFSPPFTNGVDIDAGHQRHVFCTTMSDFLGFDANVPATLLLIETAQQQVHQVMMLFIWMIFGFLTILTLALIDFSGCHWLHLSF
jgi:hypothetical protein